MVKPHPVLERLDSSLNSASERDSYWEAAGEDSSTGVPAAHMGDPHRVLSSWLLLGPVPADCSI